MNFLLTGISHQNAPLDILERVAISEDELPSHIRDLTQRLEPHDSATILSTCNRTEIYAATRNAGQTMEEMITFLSFLASRNHPSSPRRRESTRDLTSLPHNPSSFPHDPSSFPRRRESTPSNQNHPQPDLSPYIYTKSGYDAVHHLFRVVTGLDSLVQGDHQVAGQVSRSFQALANVDKPADPVLSRMFHVAFRTGRTARKESGLGWSQVSIPSFGVKLLEREIGNLNGKSALLVGAGETGRITASSLMRSGIADMRIASRSQARSKGLADDMNAKSIPIQNVGHEMANVDIVITCTGATQNIILKKDIQQHIHNRSNHLHILDLGLPRDVEPTVAELPNVRLFTLQHLQRLQAEHQKSIAQASQKAETIVAQAAAEFIDDIEIQPLLRDIGESAERIRTAELQRTLAKLQNLDPDTRQAIEAMTRSIVKRILADPIQILKRRNR